MEVGRLRYICYLLSDIALVCDACAVKPKWMGLIWLILLFDTLYYLDL